jgi:2,4-dienoyl-CoA reductase-like NADH-dependent reductase (Old Yellow Enzyme family)
MSVLFESVKIGNFDTRNRFVRSATYFALADDEGYIGEPSVILMKNLAEGGVGLIITGYAYISKSGQSFVDMNGINTDEQIAGYKKMTQAVHGAGGRIAMQIAHCGTDSETTARTGGDYMAVSVTDKMPNYGNPAREMTEEDIQSIIESFGQAARRVEEAGFDGVQIHGAHGYLVSQFLTPRSNLRQDKWGGNLENRMRFVVEVVRSIRQTVSSDFPIMIKLGCRDYLDEGVGLTIEEGAEVAQTLEKEGVSLIEISSGLQDASYRKKRLGTTSPEKEAYYLDDARVVREKTSGPLSMVGGMRSLPVMEDAINSGVVDCISICRPLIREPGLINRWQKGDARPADCISCGGCFNVGEDGKMSINCRQLLKKQAKA